MKKLNYLIMTFLLFVAGFGLNAETMSKDNVSSTKETTSHKEMATFAGYISNRESVTFTKLANHTDVTAEGTYMIVDVNGGYALTSANGSSSAPTAVSVVIENNTIQGDIAAELQWKFTAVEGGYKISPLNDNSVFLYSTSSNNGVRVGSGDANVWTLDITNASSPNYHGFLNNEFNRYLGVYLPNPDWRTYTSIHDNIKNTQIEIFELNGTPTPPVSTVATPVFSPAAGVYNSAQTVTITCNTEDASIYYTLDGSTPTASSTLYNSPITVSNTTTVKAIGVKSGMNNSNVATATYEIVTLQSIAEVRALSTGSTASVQGIVTRIDGRNVFIQDETAAIDLYLNYGTVPSSLAIGDKVNATGTIAEFRGLLELSNIDGNNSSEFSIISNNNTLPLATKTIAEINSDFAANNMLQSTRVLLENVTTGAINYSGNTSITQDGNSVNIYRIPQKEGLAEGDNIDVIAIIGCYNDPQLLVNTAEDITINVSSIAMTPSELSGFEYNEGEGPSAAQQFAVTGSLLNGDINITVSSDFEVSMTEGGAYNSSLTLSPISGSVNSTLYVRMKAGLASGEHTGTITATYNSLNENITLAGNVVAASSTLTFNRIANHTDVTAEGTYMIVDFNGGYALTSANGSSSAPTAVSVVIENNTIQGDIAAELQWKFTAVEGGYKISPLNDNSVFLYSTNDNNGVRVGGGDANIWTLDITNASTPDYHGFLNNEFNRYLGVYNGNDWRTYTSVHNNIKNTQIEIFILGDVPTPPVPSVVATPEFSPEGGLYTTEQNVAISCATEGATIYYTTNGDEPTTSSSVYNNPIAVTTTTTIKAMAVKDGMENSEVAVATYTFPTLIDIAAARVLANNETAYIEGVVTFIDGRNIYVQDETAAIDLYLNNNTVPETLALGDKVRALGTKTVYNGLVELTGIDGTVESEFRIVSSGNILPSAVKTIVELLADFEADNMLQSTRVQIVDAVMGTINNNGNTIITQDDNEMVIYRLPVVEGLMEGDLVTLTAVVGCFNNIQLRVNSADDVTFTHNPYISVTPNSLSGFEYVVNNGPSEEKTFTMSASYLHGSVSVISPENYEVSSMGGNLFYHENPLVINTSSGYFNNLNIYVRLKAGLETGSYQERIAIVSEDIDTIYVNVNGSVSDGQGGSEEYRRIASVSDLGNSDKVVFAARYNSDATSYYAMTNETSGKPEGVLFTSTTSGTDEVLPADINNNIDSYFWTATIENGNYVFTNAEGEVLGYSSGTNFSTGGDNTQWVIASGVSDPAAMVPDYTAFSITNANVTNRAFAINTSHNFGAYSTTNMTGGNAGDYNFFIDMFVLSEGSGTTTVATPTFSPAGGTYYEPQTVSINCNTEGATIYYTTDGTEPTVESSVYNSPLVIANSTTVKAIACKEGMENSNVATAEYNIMTGVVTIFDQDWEGEMNGWTFVNVSGSGEWSIASYNNNHYAYINGYGTGANVDWCISPAFNLNEYSNTVLTFTTAKNYTGPDLEVYFSNDYDGSNPETATWTPLTCTLSSGSWTWTPSGDISLNGFSGNNCHIGFKYTSTEENQAGWEVDDCLLVGSTTNPVLTATPNVLNGFSYIAGNGPSAEQMFNINGMNLTAGVTVTASENYEISLTAGESFSAQESISITPENGAINSDIYVRLAAGLNVGTYEETITIASEDVNNVTVSCNGSVNEEGDEWHRIYSVSEISDNSRIIIASRYDASVNDGYYVMTAGTSGKPEGVLCSSITNSNGEVLPSEITDNAETYCWTVTMSDNQFILINSNGDTLGYGGSGTNFATGGENIYWDIDFATAGDAAMVPNYSGFTIINSNYARGVAQNASHNFGPYSTQNINTADYNFYQDIFIEGPGGTPTVAAPVFTPAAGTYYEVIDVEITCSTEDATIYYTTDGSEPDSTSTEYSGNITVDNDMTIKAIAYKEGMNHSNVSTASYIIRDNMVIIFDQDWENDWNGWTQVSIDESESEWTIAEYNNNHYAYANAYNQGANEDWLLSPAFNLDEYSGSNIILTFTNAKNYTGPDVELLFSNDYDGNDPNNATWTPLSFNMSTGGWSWAESGEIMLNDFSGDNCYIAFKYTSTETEAAGWEIDDIMLIATDGSAPYLTATPNTLSGFTYLEGEGPSETQTYTLSAGNLEGEGNVTVTADVNYEISTDNEVFEDMIELPYSNGSINGQPVNIYVRLKADLAIGTYEGVISHECEGITTEVTLEGNVTSSDVPVISNETVPLYIQGASGTNNNRLPYAFNLTLSNLASNTTYRYINQAVTSDDGATANGAGNIIFVDTDGFYRTTSPSLETEGNYGEFTTDSNGSYTGWFILEATANARFTPGNQVYMRLRLNDGNDGTTAVTYLTTASYATVLGFGNESDETQGTAVWATSDDAAMSFVLLHDDIDSKGRPIYGTSVESCGVDFSNISQYATFYKDNVAGVNGAWGGIIPNVNENGIQRITVYDIEGGLTNEYSTPNGVWGTTNTVNPNGGISSPLHIDLRNLSVEDNMFDNVRIYTNRYNVVIENNSGKLLNAVVYNILGQPVVADDIAVGTNIIKYQFNSGAYIVRINDSKSMKATKVIIR